MHLCELIFSLANLRFHSVQVIFLLSGALCVQGQAGTVHSAALFLNGENCPRTMIVLMKKKCATRRKKSGARVECVIYFTASLFCALLSSLCFYLRCVDTFGDIFIISLK